MNVSIRPLLLAWAVCAGAAAGAPEEPRIVREDFGAGVTLEGLGERWDFAGVPWTVRGGALGAEAGTTRGWAVLADAPIAGRFEASVRMTVERRGSTDDWAVAGLAMTQDTGNFWQLALVEGPDGKRYAELLEVFDGAWQAQNQTGTVLKAEVSEGTRTPWDYGRPYVLRLACDETAVTGEIAEPDSGKVRTRIRYRWNGARGVREGRPALTAASLAAAFRGLEVRLAPTPVAAGVNVEDGAAGRVAILDDRIRGLDRAAVTNLAGALRAAGFGVTSLRCADLDAPGMLSAVRFDALVLTDARRFPGPAADALARYLRSGGDLVLLGGLPFSEPVWPAAGEWVVAADLANAVAATPDGMVLHDFEDGTAKGWSRSSNAATNPSAMSVESGPRGRCLRFDVRGLSGWDNLRTALPPRPADGANALALWAKGDAATTKLAVELREEDGARWIAVIDLATEWRRHVLPAWRFEYWRDSRVTGRGGPGDRVNFGRVRELSIGQSFSHTGNLPGDRTFWFDRVALASTDVQAPATFDLELPIGSEYEVYRLDDIRSAVAAPGQGLVAPGTRIEGAFTGWSAIGFAFPGESRYVPLLEARDRHGRLRGAAAGLLVHHRGAWRDSCWLMSGLEGPAFARDPAVAPALVAALKAMRSGALVREAREAAAAPVPANPPLTTPPPHVGFIRRAADGRHLVYPDGRRFFMTGCNYIGSFALCGGRMWQAQYYDPRVLEDDFRKARQAGLNAMRFWLQPSFEEALRRGDRAQTDAIREYARRYGVYLLIDLPGTGYATEAEMVASHRLIAQAFADEPMVLGYDLRNEPYVTTLGSLRYDGDPAPVLTRDLQAAYPDRVDTAGLEYLLRERPYWLHMPGSLKGDEARRVATAWQLWNGYTKQFGLGGSTLTGLGAETPAKGWEDLVGTVDASLARWLRSQLAAVRAADTNHLITVGHNTALAVLPANAPLDFVSQHVYARPFDHEAVKENFTTLDRLAKRWPDRPISLGEFGYSNGIRMKDGRYLDPHASAVGEMMHFLHALAHDYDGCKKWMLADWPLAVMRRYGDWNRGLETRIYEERFGLYSYDGTPGGRAKPVVAALRFLRDHIDRAGPGGTLAVTPGPTPIGAVYEFRAPGARFVGHVKYRSDDLAFEAAQPANVMLRWEGGRLVAMATADAAVSLRPGALVAGLRPDAKIGGVHAAVRIEGEWLSIGLLEGETVTLAP